MKLELVSYRVDLPASGLNVHYLATANVHDHSGPVVFLHHGLGLTSASFVPLFNELVKILSAEPRQIGLVMPDMRNHGTTRPIGPSSGLDLRIELLDQDLINFILSFYPNPSKAPELFIVGHSLGGAPATRTIPNLIDRGYRIGGLAVLEAVETTLKHIPEMTEGFKRWPSGFVNARAAIDWHVAACVINNRSSADITVPPILQPSHNPDLPLTWRTPILSTTEFWQGWYAGLSSAFLEVPCPKILVLTRQSELPQLFVDALETNPCAFKLTRMGEGVGHFVHEDDPEKVARILADFIFQRRNIR